MKNPISIARLTILAAILSIISVPAFAQASGQMKRTTSKTETFEAGPGTTLSIIGSPLGSIRIEGWSKNEIEISADIEVMAASEQDLTALAEVTGFMIDEGLTKISVVTVGPHDKKYLKKAVKDFPKRLRNSPFRIDYSIKVPVYTDLIVDGGKGDFFLSGVEGSMSIELLESDARLELTGGAIIATIGKGDVAVRMLKPSWRGRFAEVQVASGSIDLGLPPDLNANLQAKVLRTGQIEHAFKNLKPVRRTKFSDTSIDGIAGNGGAKLSFTVGDGRIMIGVDNPVNVANK